MQFNVPQFINVEDKIVGPFTGKQTVYLMLGGGILLFAFTFFNIVFFIIVALIVAPLTLGFVFYKPRGITLAQYMGNFIEYFTTSHLYIWKREPTITMYKTVQKKHAVDDAPVKTVSKSRIRELADLLDTSAAISMPYETKTRPDENIFRR